MVRSSLFVVVLFIFIVFGVCLPQPIYAQDVTFTPSPATTQEHLAEITATVISEPDGIFFPEQGALLRGVVDIKGSAQSDWNLSFSYQDNPTDTWFLLDQSNAPVSNGMFARWDTTSVPDGVYVLRLRLMTENGFQNLTVNVRVGNQLPEETATSTPTPKAILELIETTTSTQVYMLEVAVTPTLLVLPTRLPALPANPAVLNFQDIFINLWKGVLAVLVVFGFAGFFLFLRRK